MYATDAVGLRLDIILGYAVRLGVDFSEPGHEEEILYFDGLYERKSSMLTEKGLVKDASLC